MPSPKLLWIFLYFLGNFIIFHINMYTGGTGNTMTEATQIGGHVLVQCYVDP